MLIAFGNAFPSLAEGVWVAPGAIVTGDVEIGAGSSIWFQCVIRGDESAIRIGRETNVQDACILHTQSRNGLRIGDRVSVGHMAVLHGCEIGEGALIGIGSVILDGAVIGRNCIVGAGSLVTPNSRFEDEQVILGRPAKTVRAVTAAEVEENKIRAQRYVRNAAVYAAGGRAPRRGSP
jgi:carbonic anhydrase/acetyltransferase-like protein (isoleucine patch superfamily)